VKIAPLIEKKAAKKAVKTTPVTSSARGIRRTEFVEKGDIHSPKGKGKSLDRINKLREPETTDPKNNKLKSVTCFTAPEWATGTVFEQNESLSVINDTRSNRAFAKRTTSNKGTVYQIRMSANLLCYDPWGMDSLRMFTWQIVSQKKFDHYVRYLNCKQKRCLQYANRIIAQTGVSKE
jgi:hypothetical protein